MTDTISIRVRQCHSDEVQQIRTWLKAYTRKSTQNNPWPFDLMHAFDGTWGRKGSPPGNVWQTSPPILAWMDSEIIGIGAADYTSESYVNSYYSIVHKDFRGQGVGKELFNAKLREGHRRGMKRWTAQCKINGDGHRFYHSMIGIEPVGRHEDIYIFDFSIEGLLTVEDAKVAATAGTILRLDEIPMVRRKRYAKRWNAYLQPGVIDGNI